ncbi:hypothetical protein BDR05DRAFT_420172 [Suillus weaverae]|nr:hypothetical protein BDR05DRAFT_420172 [Suillus weaverae]
MKRMLTAGNSIRLEEHWRNLFVNINEFPLRLCIPNHRTLCCTPQMSLVWVNIMPKFLGRDADIDIECLSFAANAHHCISKACPKSLWENLGCQLSLRGTEMVNIYV